VGKGFFKKHIFGTKENRNSYKLPLKNLSKKQYAMSSISIMFTHHMFMKYKLTIFFDRFM